ncbi:hypothetical protein F511_41149 [Dorcoceras hygrometricum]|uniref:Uncharacterized protein n=1 Tax=Dorcoceras hygrometricum TaxID=472368 RepID=A0A2Z7DAH1_9LAMI|nr:hypothetical protein F511_41149 [Dorcoceras hygrometricum]
MRRQMKDPRKDQKIGGMRTRGDKRPSRKNDRKVLVAEESTGTGLTLIQILHLAAPHPAIVNRRNKLCEIQKPTNDRTGLGFNTCESSFGETCTQSNLAYDKFKKMSFVKASVIDDPCESVRYDDQISEPLNKKGKACIGYDRLESSKSGWLKNRLDKEKEKAGSKSFV